MLISWKLIFHLSVCFEKFVKQIKKIFIKQDFYHSFILKIESRKEEPNLGKINSKKTDILTIRQL